MGGNGIGVGGEVEDRTRGDDDTASGCVGEVQEYTFELRRRSRLFRRRHSDFLRLYLLPLQTQHRRRRRRLQVNGHQWRRFVLRSLASILYV